MNSSSSMPLQKILNLPPNSDLPTSIHQDLSITLDIVGEKRYSQLQKIGLSYNGWIITHVVEGVVEYWMGPEFYFAHPGDVMIHFPNVTYSEMNPNPGFAQYLIFDAKLSAYIDLLHFYPLPPVVRLSDPALFQHTVTEIHKQFKQPVSEIRDLHIYTLMTSALLMLISSWVEQGKPPRTLSLRQPHDDLMTVITFIQQNFHRKISRQDLAKIIHTNPNYLDTRFKKVFKQTPMEMLREIRIQKAAQLLQTTNFTLEHIATECALIDAANLSKMFKQHFAMSPGEFRKQKNKMKTMLNEGFIY